MKTDDLPPVVRKHPELANLLRYTENNPEAHPVLMEFFRVCEHLTRKQLAEVFAYGERFESGTHRPSDALQPHPDRVR